MVITGVIKPPPEIRAVADRTASFVAKNGRAFESRILNSDKGKTPKFAFLHTTSPFHAYYEDRISFYEQGGDDENADDSKERKCHEGGKLEDEKEEQRGDLQRKKEKAQKASALDPVARALLQQRAIISEAKTVAEGSDKLSENQQPATGVDPAPELMFASIAAPANLSPVQLETIKLVAQLTALNGKGGPFLQQIAIREWENPLFAFVQPRHGHFAYFSALVDGYRLLMSMWTSDAVRDESKGLPVEACADNVSKCLDVAAYKAEYDRDVAESKREESEEGGGLSGAAVVDWHDFVVVETIEFAVDEVVASIPPPKEEEPQEEIMEESDDEGGEKIRVVPNYTPKVVSTQNVALDTSRTHIIDPITGKSVALADMSEHMRIQLLDPKWAEERKKFVEKQKESNLVGGDDVANNISRFAQARGGFLGSSDSAISNNQADPQKQIDQANPRGSEQPQIPQSLPQATGPGASPPAVPMPFNSTTLPAAKKPRLETMHPPPVMESAPNYTVPYVPPPGPESQLPPPAEPPKEVELLSETDFAKTLEDTTVHLSVQIPNDASNSAWNFHGQVVTLSVDVMSKVKSVKDMLRAKLGEMPMNKIQLKSLNGFMKDGSTLASLNIGPSAAIELVPKTRGGRK